MMATPVHPRLFLVALQLLTRLPVGDPMESDRDVADSVAWYAVVGALVGGLSGFVWWMAALALPTRAAAVLAVGATVMLTGALHEDGLADTADGLFGGRTPADRLRIMKDSATGAYGVLALVLIVLLRVNLLAVAIVVVVEANLIQRVNLAPEMIVIVPMVARGVQSLLLRAGDDMVGVTPPSPRAKLGIGIILLGLLTLPIPLQSLVRPERLNGPLDVVGYLTLGVAALIGAFVAGGITRAWTMARFGPLDPRGWHAIGLFAEVAALVVVAVRID